MILPFLCFVGMFDWRRLLKCKIVISSSHLDLNEAVSPQVHIVVTSQTLLVWLRSNFEVWQMLRLCTGIYKITHFSNRRFATKGQYFQRPRMLQYVAVSRSCLAWSMPLSACLLVPDLSVFQFTQNESQGRRLSQNPGSTISLSFSPSNCICPLSVVLRPKLDSDLLTETDGKLCGKNKNIKKIWQRFGALFILSDNQKISFYNQQKIIKSSVRSSAKSLNKEH